MGRCTVPIKSLYERNGFVLVKNEHKSRTKTDKNFKELDRNQAVQVHEVQERNE
jgi:hypothetical protein